jgi:hypothetical protein
MPSGSYILKQPGDAFLNLLSISSSDGSKYASIIVIPTQSLDFPKHSKVIFKKYGDNMYLDRIVVNDSVNGLMTEPTRAEKKAEQHAGVAGQQSVTIAGQ